MTQQRQRRAFGRRLPQYRSVCVLALQKRTDRLADLAGMGFQREMAGVKEAHSGAGNVALERFGTRRQEERIVLAPHREERRLVFAEIVLEGRVERDVALVVAKQIELYFVGARTGEVEGVEAVAVRRYRRLVGDPVGILPARGFRREEGAQRLSIVGRGAP